MELGTLAIDVCLFIALFFEVFLLIAFFERKPSTKTREMPKHFPSITMVVPCFNEEKTLKSTIESLLQLEYPKEKLSIMIVDDGSKDNTRKISEELAKQYRQVEYVFKENGGKYTALNLAIERVQTDLIGCLDADSFVVKDALIEAVKKFESDPAVMAITPAMKVHKPTTILELMQSVEYTFGIFYKKMFDNLAALNVLPGPFSIYRKEVFQKIGLFRHAHNTEDMEIAFRMHAHGLKIVNAHTALVYTTVPTTLRSLIKQRTRWSQGFLQNSRDYSYMFFNPRFGHFGMFVLPFGFVAFFAGLFTAMYAAYHLIQATSMRALDMYLTQIPPHLSPVSNNLNWFYLNTTMTSFLILVTFSMTIVAIFLGSKIADSKITAKSLFSYFAFFGFIAPFWLARAAWGAALARESKWR
ncbi:glycosyltransferase family 2 protein [Candidatus Parcubacteria bacterium]|nr:glycosyltransferase family 2 protein [Candidatus Parcubacteria bacterium]